MGTKNPGKIQGAKEAFEKYFANVEIEGIAVDSEVGDQPFNQEIIQGAKNRVKNLKRWNKLFNKKCSFKNRFNKKCIYYGINKTYKW